MLNKNILPADSPDSSVKPAVRNERGLAADSGTKVKLLKPA